MEAAVEVVRASSPVFPQELAQNRATILEKVFTVRHHCDDQACEVDTLFFIKGLDKHNMPRSGDVMVPASQIQEHTVDGGGAVPRRARR